MVPPTRQGQPVASVFLSYDREDEERGIRIARALEKAGHSVWWDQRIQSGAQYAREIDEALRRSEAVVVLWSRKSIDSVWVRDEAAAGRDAGKLVPARIDEVEPPLGFRQFQTTDLTRWKGRAPSREFAELLDAIKSLAGAEGPAPAMAAGPKRRAWRVTLPVVAGLTAVALLAAALLFWRPWDRGSSAPMLAVVAGDQSPGAKALARDLLVKFGTLQAMNAESLKLVGSLTDKPDFILQVTGSALPQEVAAGLAILSGKDRSLLWSRDFTQPRDREADLRQQLAYSAAQALECATKAARAKPKLSHETRKFYLNGCAQLAEHVGDDIVAVVPILERVTQAAPHFRDGWAKLLMAQSQVTRIAFVTTGDNRNEVLRLRRYIANARRHHGETPEVLAAELELIPPGLYTERLKRVDRAKNLEPDNPIALEARAGELLAVGRGNDAVVDAERAAKLNPLSAAVRNGYINTLAYSGRLTSAAEALNQAERLWPETSSVLDAKFRFHLRYGDPAVALELYRTRSSMRIHELTLRARRDPTPANIESAARMARSIFVRFEAELPLYSQVMAELGREEEIYASIAELKDPLAREGTDIYFRPTLKKFREDPRFMLLARRLGLLDYWRTSGHWPDFCFDTDLPYDCKAEAARLASVRGK
jgi:tetratricopeptide (TPR) repeat protein